MSNVFEMIGNKVLDALSGEPSAIAAVMFTTLVGLLLFWPAMSAKKAVAVPAADDDVDDEAMHGTGVIGSMYQVLSQVHPQLSVSFETREVLLRALSDVAARGIAATGPRRPVAGGAMRDALCVVIGHELAKHAMAEMDKAAQKELENARPGAGAPEPGSMEDIFGPALQFHPAELTAELRRRGTLSEGASLERGAEVCLAACLEYVTAEVWELAGNRAVDDKAREISTQHLAAAVAGDAALAAVLSSSIAAGAKAGKAGKAKAGPADGARRRDSAVA
jgi:hypothetical protein